MSSAEILESLKRYVAREILDGKDMGLSPETPLLEWGILNSIEIGRLIAYLQERFHVTIPDDQIAPQHFVNLKAVAALVASRMGQG